MFNYDTKFSKTLKVKTALKICDFPEIIFFLGILLSVPLVGCQTISTPTPVSMLALTPPPGATNSPQGTMVIVTPTRVSIPAITPPPGTTSPHEGTPTRVFMPITKPTSEALSPQGTMGIPTRDDSLLATQPSSDIITKYIKPPLTTEGDLPETTKYKIMFQTFSPEGSIYFWEVKTGKQNMSIKVVQEDSTIGQTSLVNSISFNKDGSSFVSGDALGGINIWDSNSGQKLGSFVEKAPDSIPEDLEILFNPNGKTLLMKRIGGALGLLDATTGVPYLYFLIYK